MGTGENYRMILPPYVRWRTEHTGRDADNLHHDGWLAEPVNWKCDVRSTPFGNTTGDR